MPADAGGFAKAVQVISLFGMLYCIKRSKSVGIFDSLKVKNSGLNFLALLYLWATLSFIWSPLPQFAFFLGFQNVVLIMLLVWLFHNFRDARSLERFFIISSMIIAILDSILVRLIDYHSFIAHHLPAASACALVFSYCVGEIMNNKHMDKQRYEMLKWSWILCAFILVISTSSGANASAICGVAMAMLLSRKLSYAILLFAVGAFLTFNQDYVEQLLFFIMPGKTAEDISTATGRERLWDAMLILADERPWTGWGFGCVERVAWDEGMIPFPVPDAHSNFVGFYGSLGIIGCLLAAVHFTSSILFSWTRRLRPGFVGVIAALTCALMNGYSYGFLASKACLITVVYFALIVLIYYYSRLPYDASAKRK